MRQNRSAARIEERVWCVTRTGAVGLVSAERQSCVRVQERPAQRCEDRCVITPVCLDASLERPVELRESRRRCEIGESRTERERKRGSSGVESRQSIVEERCDLREDGGLGDDWSRISRRSDIHIDRRSEVVARIDDIQVVERLDGLGETLDRRLLGRGYSNHFIHGAEKNVRVSNIPIRSGEQVAAERPDCRHRAVRPTSR